MIIFVFGSNLAGRHGKGAALIACQKYGALRGVGKGRTGQSYAIPTKDKHLKILPLKQIALYVEEFITYAENNPELNFLVTRVGCGLAGYEDNEIAPLFVGAPANCFFSSVWAQHL